MGVEKLHVVKNRLWLGVEKLHIVKFIMRMEHIVELFLLDSGRTLLKLHSRIPVADHVLAIGKHHRELPHLLLFPLHPLPFSCEWSPLDGFRLAGKGNDVRNVIVYPLSRGTDWMRIVMNDLLMDIPLNGILVCLVAGRDATGSILTSNNT